MFLILFNGEDVKRLVEVDGCVFKEVKKYMCVFFGDEYLVVFFVFIGRYFKVVLILYW